MFSRRSREFKSGESRFSTGSDSDVKIDDSTIRAVETSLREALTLNNEEARALLGRIEFQKEDFQSALHILEGIQVDNIFPRVKFLVPAKNKHKRGKIRSEIVKHQRRSDVPQPLTLQSAILLLEGVYLKVMSLEHLGRSSDAAEVCNFLVESFDATFPHGLPDHLAGTKIQEFYNKVLEFLPEFFKREGHYADAVVSYRKALRSHWEPGSKTLCSLQLGLAVLLLYGGFEAPPCPSGVYEGDFVPSNSVEEAILLLIDAATKSMVARTPRCLEVMEHLCFALATCGHFEALAQQYESVVPGIYSRTERWFSLALCYMAARDNKEALNLLRKALGEVERPNDVSSLLHAASICSGSARLAPEGVKYSQKAIDNAKGEMEYLKGKAWQVLGIVLSVKARAAASNAERSAITKEALSAWHEASKLERVDAKTLFHFGLVHAEEGNLRVAMKSAKKFLEVSCASATGWRFLALVLSAQQRFRESELVIDAGLEEVNSWEQGELWLTKAKLQVAQGKHLDALETYKLLLALSAEKKTSIPELTVWREMADACIALSQWNDAKNCLEKAKCLDVACAGTWHGYGLFFMAQSKSDEALAAFDTALTCDPEYVESKVQIGAVLSGYGGKSLPVARSFLNDALRLEPRNPSAWFHLGAVHEMEGRMEQAAECFHTAYILDQSLPVESFGTLLEIKRGQ
ncbi:hypothetical protein SELMODRAFT_404439 [Selaginella moellendorffii]|uniref:Uncharacterized protein n=1 Tax=Selaginella moellendorffii TaxID=88036 RepID=D8QVB9_SELML|nr:protein NPG1 [Selaginella moellendorffii]EFJ36031.1 hypothetical protein SELMODRAFT_404439 [Selaginella moellendorffii]|eukprot:XP_002962568.1 protein NPG1 [Selaginella moellendorffii]